MNMAKVESASKVQKPYRDHLTLHRRRRPFRLGPRRRSVVVRAATVDRRSISNTSIAFCGGDGAGDGGEGEDDAGAGLLIELVHRSMQGPP